MQLGLLTFLCIRELKKVEESAISCSYCSSSNFSSSDSLTGNIGGLLVWGNAGINTWIDFFFPYNYNKINIIVGPAGRNNSSIDLPI